jgi:hypothetical protein
MMVVRQKDSKATIVWRIILGSLSTATFTAVMKIVALFSTVIQTQAVQDQRLNSLELNYGRHEISIKAISDTQIKQGESINYLSSRRTHTQIRDNSND